VVALIGGTPIAAAPGGDADVPYGIEQLQALDEVKEALDKDHEDVCQLLGGAWVGEEAVACALWCVLKAKGDFDESIRRGANSSGDSDSIACIAGSIAGALCGIDGIDKTKWRDKLERGADIDELAQKLFDVKDTKKDAPSLPGKLDFFDAELALADTLDSDRTAGGDDPVEVKPISALTIEELEAAVVKHNALYWEHAAPVITDVEFDKLTRRLKELKPSSDALLHLGAKPREREVKHAQPMLSLDKCYEQVELEAWAKDVNGDVVIMPKVDGLACSLRYDADGRLEIAATRGDGEVGEDITPNARAVKDIPQKIAIGPCEVRGEVYMSLAEFEKHKADKANPRNLAAGALRVKDPNETRRLNLSFYAYDLRGTDEPSFAARLEKLATLGFPRIDTEKVAAKDVFTAVDRMAARRNLLAFETDGVVVSADDIAERARLGVTAHHPRWAIAWKFQGEAGQSVLRDIEWSVARTGTITPVAIVDPVQLSGVTVTRATLHHIGYVAKLGLTIGATLAMVRRGGVIPHVERVITPGAKEVEVPVACPACGSATTQEGDFLMCSTPETCTSAKIGRVLHFLDAIGVMGMGEAIVEEAFSANLLKTPADLYRLTVLQLAQLEKCGEKNGAKIVKEIAKAKSLPLDVLLKSLGIESLGKTAALKVAEAFGTLAKVRAATPGELSKLKGVGDVVAQSIHDGLKENAALLDDLLTLVSVADVKAPEAGPLTGKSFVFTGALTIDRKQAETRVKKLGGAVPSSVNKTLTYLVVGGSGREEASTKQKAADKLKAEGAPIEIIDEQAFLALLAPLESAAPAPAAPPAPPASTPVTGAEAATDVTRAPPDRRAGSDAGTPLPWDGPSTLPASTPKPVEPEAGPLFAKSTPPVAAEEQPADDGAPVKPKKQLNLF
jgi:DNA ligase (NAD+)